MKHFATLACIAGLGLAGLAGAADAPAAAKPPTVVQGVKLGTLCNRCGGVSEMRTEKRKGKASGVGAVGGAVAGGVVGNQATDGGTLGTVGGAAVGGLLGNELEKRLKKRTVWIATVTLKDGSAKNFEYDADPGLKAGHVVEVGADGQLKKR